MNIALNSYEVSFLLSIFKPGWPTGIDRAELNKIISYDRREFLLEWGNKYCDHYWCKEHS